MKMSSLLKSGIKGYRRMRFLQVFFSLEWINLCLNRNRFWFFRNESPRRTDNWVHGYPNSFFLGQRSSKRVSLFIGEPRIQLLIVSARGREGESASLSVNAVERERVNLRLGVMWGWGRRRGVSGSVSMIVRVEGRERVSGSVSVRDWGWGRGLVSVRAWVRGWRRGWIEVNVSVKVRRRRGWVGVWGWGRRGGGAKRECDRECVRECVGLKVRMSMRVRARVSRGGEGEGKARVSLCGAFLVAVGTVVS